MAAPDTTAPAITGVTANSATSSSVTISWKTDEAATSQVEFGPTTAYGTLSSLDTTLLTNHSIVLSNLPASTTFQFRVLNTDNSGNAAVSGNSTFTTLAPPATPSDTIAPALAAITVRDITSNRATITWATDEPSTTEVEYGPTSQYGNSTGLNAALLNIHVQSLVGLQPNTVYHYRVKSMDALGNLSISLDDTFTTHIATDTAPPADVENFEATAGDKMITLKWVNPADADFLGVRIIYRTERFPADLEDGEILGDFTGRPNEAFSVIHAGLKSDTTYYYAASSYDKYGNYQNTAHASATPFGDLGSRPQVGGGESGSSGGAGGGCTLREKAQGPEEAADMAGITGMVLLGFIYRMLRRKRI